MSSPHSPRKVHLVGSRIRELRKGHHLTQTELSEKIGERNVGASRYASLGRRKWHAQYRPNIRENTPEGAATRENLVRVASVEQARRWYDSPEYRGPKALRFKTATTNLILVEGG